MHYGHNPFSAEDVTYERCVCGGNATWVGSTQTCNRIACMFHSSRASTDAGVVHGPLTGPREEIGYEGPGVYAPDLYAAPEDAYTGCETLPDDVALRVFRREPAPVMTYDVGAYEGVDPSSSALGIAVYAVVAVTLVLCAYVGYRLTHSGEFASMAVLPLGRLRRARSSEWGEEEAPS